MKLSFTLITTAFLTLGLLMGCSKSSDDEKIEDEANNTKASESSSIIETSFYSLEGTGLSWTGIPKNKITIVNSSESLKQYLSGAGEHPIVDFSQYSILLVKKSASADSGPYEAILSLTNASEYILNVKVGIGIFCVVTEWTIAILAPKISDDINIALETKEIPRWLPELW